MNLIIDQNKFPRTLSQRELQWLQFILPENRSGYAEYRKKLDRLFVIGNGRFGETNLILGNKNEKPDLSSSSSPMFASGNIIFKEAEIYVLIHEETEGQIEIDISNIRDKYIPDELNEISRWTYSNWKPGQMAPGDNSDIREIHLVKNKLVIAIAPFHKRIWVYDSTNEVNNFIPVTNFFNEIMRIRKIKDARIFPKPSSIFSENKSYSDAEIAEGFLLYNKNWKKIKLDYSLFTKEKVEKKKKSFLDFFKQRG